MAEDTAAATAATTDHATAAQTAASTDDDLENVLKDAKNPDAVKNAIDRQKAEARAQKERADAAEKRAQELEDAQKTDQQKKDEAAAKDAKRADAAEKKALRYEVAASKGVPLSQAHRLQGDTKEALEQDADEFLKDVKPGNTGGQLDGGARGNGDAPQDMDAAIRAAAGYR